MNTPLRTGCVVLIVILAFLRTTFAASPPALTAEERRGAAGDQTNFFGDDPANPGPIADLDPSMTSVAVKKAMQKVADWQLQRAEKHFDQQWTFATLYCGFLSASQSTGDLKFRDAMLAMGENFQWDISGSATSAARAAADAPPAPGPGDIPDLNALDAPPQLDPAQLAAMRRLVPINANSECLSQTYLELYFQYNNPWMLAATRQAFDQVMSIDHYPASLPPGLRGGGGAPANPQRTRGRGRGASTRPADQGMDPALNPHHLIWWWCDALYMGPPAWARLYHATEDPKYLAYIDRHWWRTSQYLYDPVEHLYFRDNSFLAKHEANGQKVFWSRGNGWVIAGLARVLQYMPADYPTRPQYVKQFQEMAAKIASIQGQDGLWRAGMLDPDYYGLPENSGSAFFTFAMAWGINQGILDRATFEPVVTKAWQGLVSHIHADGRLDCIQQTGSGPAHFRPSASYVYGVGAFLMAGREVNRLALTMMMEHRR
jgi:unsaturated rhamnogalacturonyl hydrolase